MKDVMKIVRSRHSVRTFDGREVGIDDLNKLSAFIKTIENPYDIPIEFEFLDGKKQDLSCPVVSGTNLYVGAKAPRVPHILQLAGIPAAGLRRPRSGVPSARGGGVCLRQI